MRKGRSQRKTRGSLPPTSKRPLSRLARLADGSPSSQSGDSGNGGGGPQVVVGLMAPPADLPLPHDVVDARDAREAPDAVDSRDALEPETARLELVREQNLELVEDAPAAETAVAHPRVETLTFDAADAADDDAVNEAAAAPVNRASHVASLPTPDEMSIPPMGDLSVEPIADRFFSEGEMVAARAHETEEWDERASKAVLKSLPEVVQRRARLAKYVRWAVGGAAVVCLAALARTAVPPSASAQGTSASLAMVEAPAAKAATVAVANVAPVEPVKTPEPVSAPIVAVPAAADVPAVPAAADVPAAAPAAAADVAAAAPAAVAAPADAPAAPAVAVSDKTALQEKNDSRRALERGKLGDAIAAGERSVALDPTDGEAWLLLGAAYQEKGKNADARRCYSSCVKEGKRGPLGECRALIH